MTYFFHPEAEEEFFQAVEYYESRTNGLGFDFALEVYMTIQNILKYPKAWPILMKKVYVAVK